MNTSADVSKFKSAPFSCLNVKFYFNEYGSIKTNMQHVSCWLSLGIPFFFIQSLTVITLLPSITLANINDCHLDYVWTSNENLKKNLLKNNNKQLFLKRMTI
jgi:hypothetical protein